MLPGIVYEYYASQSGLEPTYLFTLSQHERWYFAKSVGLDPSDSSITDESILYTFYTTYSGLTPPDGFSYYDHVQEYYDTLVLPDSWAEILKWERIDGSMAVSNSGTLGALNATAFDTFDAIEYQSVSIQVTGAFVGTITFQVSDDGANWVTKNLVSAAGASATSTTTTGVWNGDIGSRYFRVNMTAYTSGTANVVAVWSRQSQSNNLASQAVSGSVTVSSGTVTANLGTGGTGATSLGKAEDAAHSSGDTGVATWGVRQPTTPASPTSAAGDYSYILVDAEGKQIPSGMGAPETAFQSYTNLTTTSNVPLRAAGAAGIRNYVKNLVVENTGASASRVIVQDGTTTIFSATVPGGTTQVFGFDQPLRGTAATALNAQLGAAGTVSVTLSGFLGI